MRKVNSKLIARAGFDPMTPPMMMPFVIIPRKRKSRAKKAAKTIAKKTTKKPARKPAKKKKAAKTWRPAIKRKVIKKRRSARRL
jgi:hypothetical protein